jgi:hypothetical protein
MDHGAVLLTDATPGIGHNKESDTVDAVVGLKRHLASTYRDLIARFTDLEHGCARVPEAIYSVEEARLVTDFIAQCQAHLHRAEAAHKIEKAIYLQRGRAVDGFFKRRCESLTEALVPIFSRLKTFRDQWQTEMAERHGALLEAAESESVRVLEYRAEAERLTTSRSRADQQRGAQLHALAEASAESAGAKIREAAACLEPLRIQGDYGATAYVTHSWNVDVIDLNEVPRCYLTLNTEKVRTAVIKEGVRDIPGSVSSRLRACVSEEWRNAGRNSSANGLLATSSR